MPDQPVRQPDDRLSGPELGFLLRWRPLIDRVGGDGGQARAAKHLNWSTSTVSRDYKGDTLPTEERLFQLCSALQLPRPEMLGLAVLLRRARMARSERVRNAGPDSAGRPETGPRKAGEIAAADPAAVQPSPPGHGRRAAGRGRLLAGGLIAVMVVAAAAVSAVVLPGLTRPRTTPGGPPAARGSFSGLAPVTVHIPVTSLTPALAAAFRRGQTARAGTVTGFELRNRMSTGLCLAAVSSGPTAGKNRDPVLVTACTRAASQVWIPEQWEIGGTRYTHLVNDQYQGMCLNADNIGGLHSGHRVQLWNCYQAGNESWDFGDWHQAVRGGARSYPMFVRSGRLCLDADKYDLRVGTPVRVWTQYAAANQFWS